jgi:hypothetical protein
MEGTLVDSLSAAWRAELSELVGQLCLADGNTTDGFTGV